MVWILSLLLTQLFKVPVSSCMDKIDVELRFATGPSGAVGVVWRAPTWVRKRRLRCWQRA